MKRLSLVASLLALVTVVALRAEPKKGPGVISSGNYARPLFSGDDLAKLAYQILKTNCFECHGAAKRSGLDMRTHASITAGGSKGRVIVPHKPEDSNLYKFATQEHEIKMPPPPRERLNEADLDILRQWIEAGGSLEGVEEATTAQKNADELSSRKNGRSNRPSASTGRSRRPFACPFRNRKTPGWNANAIDAFLASAMEAKGLKPSGAADRRTLIGARISTCSDCRQRRIRSKRSLLTSRRRRGRRSSMNCSRRRITASGGRVTGWISCATRTRRASSSTSTARRCTGTATI